MRCSKCGVDNRAGRRFCSGCGSKLAIACAKCGASNEPGENFCGDCGTPLTAPAVRTALVPAPGDAHHLNDSVPTSGLIDGERKRVTALFADIKGSMELMEDLDPEEARAIVDPALKLMIDAVQRYGGFVVQSTGDGIFALFGAPVAHEDHPQRALYAALRMHEEMRRYGDRMRTQGQAPLQVRVGVNTGEVVVRSIQTGANHTEYTPIGHSTGLAARLQTVATPGTTMISASTQRLIEGFFQLKSCGPTRFKGVTEQVDVYEVTGLGPLRTRLQRAAVHGLTKFVGRQREMEALKHAAEQAQTGHGQIVAVMADPGVGKSRLFYEFKATSQLDWMVLEALSVSHGKASAYLPVLELLSEYFEIRRDDDDRKRGERILGKVLRLDRNLEDSLPYLYSLHGIADAGDSLVQMDPQIRRRRTLDAIKRILLRESLNRPLMVIFEDLHWIDAETQALLNLLVDAIANARILLLVNYRPEYRHQWGSRTHYSQLRLDPLGPENADEMLSALLGGDRELAALKRLIIERTDGTPFFMEEMVHALFEEGVLRRNGMVTLARPMSAIKAPATVQAVLASRIDRLAPAEKELLQTLAVLGREFSFTVVQRVTAKSGDELEGILAQLQVGEFINEQPAVGEVEYSFKHALTQEVAYHSILTERRKLLHERSAQAIEMLNQGRLDYHYADLAHHYCSSNNAPKAIEYLCLAGEQAARRGAYTQALANDEPALVLIDRLPEGQERLRAELGVRLMQGMCVPALFGIGSKERLQTFQRVSELGKQLGDESALFAGQLNVANAYASGGEISRALETSRRCVELAERCNDPKAVSAALLTLASCLRVSGDLVRASSLCDELMERIGSLHSGVAPEVLPVNLWIDTLVNYALVQQILGRPDGALKLIDEAIMRASQLNHPFSLAMALLFAAGLRFYRREPEAAGLAAEALIALAEEHGFREMMAFGRSARGWASAEVGEIEKGIAEVEANVALLPAGLQMMLSGLVGQVHIAAGGSDQALDIVDKTLAKIERSGTHVDEPELWRLKGEAILMRGSSHTAETEACYRRAVAIARDRSAKWLEVRASVCLARLLRKNDRREEARVMLAEIYNWFTEGFDTADLKDAKALLDELTA